MLIFSSLMNIKPLEKYEKLSKELYEKYVNMYVS